VGAAAPVLDPDQRAVVDHPGGPLLVLAGPGTGKTTTLVEAVVARIDAGIDPERVLVLTFGRKAAGELRERITARLGRTVREPLARTFHSYCFGVLRREAARVGDLAPRLLSGPEQDLIVRDLLRGEVAGLGRSSGWPAGLRPALLTHGFAQELRDLMLRCVERGVGPVDLDRLGRDYERPDWCAAARFFTQYTEITALAERAAYDPAELVRAVVDRLADPEDHLLSRERAAYDWVFVDEFQDTDPAQEALLRALVPAGGNLVVVGDADQSIYGFRGTDPRVLSRFPDTFPTLTGAPAPVVALTLCRRSAPSVLAAGAAVAARMRRSRPPTPLRALPGRAPGRVDVLLCASASQEATFVAGALRRAHVVDGVPWSRMAVLVRSTRGRLPVLRRALVAAGVPVAVSGEDLPLRDQPGLIPLLELLRVALHPEQLDEETATLLLGSALGGLDTLGLRRLRRELRHLDRAAQRGVEGATDSAADAATDSAAQAAAGGWRTPAALLVEALRDPRVLTVISDGVSRPAHRVAGLLQRVRRAAAQPGATAETVLWELWVHSGLGPGWQGASVDGGVRGAAADRDLDAVMALFEAAARFVDRLPAAGPAVFLDHLRGQEIPGDSLAARAPERGVVRILTAHAAKGLEWDVVVVADVAEGSWPDLRARGSLLGSEQLVDLVALGVDLPEHGSAPAARLLEEERRLFYVALTRARERLVVTAVADADDGDQPSRFIADVPLREDDAAPVQGLGPDGRPDRGASTSLGALRRSVTVPALVPRLRELSVDPAQPPATRDRARALAAELAGVTRSLDLTALVAELRSVVTDPAAAAGLRRCAAGQLVRLAAAQVPGADPRQWWGALPASDDRPLRAAGELIHVSPSRVEAFKTCELRWLLESVGGSGPDSAGQSVGLMVHELAAAVAADPALLQPSALLAELNRRWGSVDLGSPWFTTREQGRAGRMLLSFLGWLRDSRRELLAAELDFAVELDTGANPVRLGGRVDRIERDEHGRAVVVDLKTGTTKPTGDAVKDHPQLGAYQVAVERGGFAGLEVSAAGGASLVQLGKAAGAKGALEQVQPALGEAEDPAWAQQLVVEVAAGMAGSAFRALENQQCDRCPVRTSCPLHASGRQVVGE
jgi:superfamily I DNA/RNA helicase/RecB family exonuclease